MNIFSGLVNRISLFLLFNFPPEKAHNLALTQLNYLYKLKLIGLIKAKNNNQSKKINCMGLEFPNALGLAAGLDKNGDYINALAELGFGFIEIGTITPRAQSGNPKPRLFRLKQDQALINRMGFNNKGVDYLVEKVRKSNFKGILGINIGKNADTPMDKAVNDYLICLRKVYNYASYVTVNISSPNTKNLRDLQSADSLNSLLSSLMTERDKLKIQHAKYVPLVLKIAPDLDKEQIKAIAHVLLNNKVDAVIATNTSISRPDSLQQKVISKESGGLSGLPIRDLSDQVIKDLSICLKGKIPIIGCGGIMNSSDAKRKIDAGASLLQVYTGFIYNGVGLLDDVLGGL